MRNAFSRPLGPQAIKLAEGARHDRQVEGEALAGAGTRRNRCVVAREHLADSPGLMLVGFHRATLRLARATGENSETPLMDQPGCREGLEGLARGERLRDCKKGLAPGELALCSSVLDPIGDDRVAVELERVDIRAVGVPQVRQCA